MGGTLLARGSKDIFEKLGLQRRYNYQQRDSKLYGSAGGGSACYASGKTLSGEEYRFRSDSERFQLIRWQPPPHSSDLERPYTITFEYDYCIFKMSERDLDWKEFYPLNVIYNFLAQLETAFPSTCTVSVIGRSAEGRDIKMLKISNSDAENTGVWVDGATHAREWVTTSVVTYIADYLARHFNTISANFTNKDWYFVPVVNPDGYNHSHTADRMWRKNRARIGNTPTGVDLNRNYGYFWGRGGNDHSSGDPNHINYRGLEPFSEPETTAIKDIILYSGTPFKIFLTFHSFSEAIAFPWCHTAEPCPDYVNLLEGGTAMAKAIFETSGRMYKVGNFKDIMYYASGTSIDWSYGTARIPYSYLVELRSKHNKFLLPRDEIIICCKEILNGVKALVEFTDKTPCLNCNLNAKKLRR